MHRMAGNHDSMSVDQASARFGTILPGTVIVMPGIMIHRVVGDSSRQNCLCIGSHRLLFACSRLNRSIIAFRRKLLKPLPGLAFTVSNPQRIL